MPSKWEELGIDWNEVPSGVHLYTGLKYIIEAVNERFRIALNDPEYSEIDLEEFKGQHVGGSLSGVQIVIKLRNAASKLVKYFIPADSEPYNPADPNNDNNGKYDVLGLPDTYDSDKMGEELGKTFEEIFNPHLLDEEKIQSPHRSLIQDMYKILEKLTILKVSATSSLEYSKSIYELAFPGVDAAAVNQEYSNTATVVTEKDGSCIVPGIIYFRATLGDSGDKNWFTAFQDSYDSSFSDGTGKRTGIRAFPAPSTSGTFFFEIRNEEGEAIQPPLKFKPFLCFGGSDGSNYAGFNSTAMGGIGPSGSSFSHFRPMDNWPRPLMTFTEVTPSYQDDKYTYDIFCDPTQPDGLPAESEWEDGNNSKRFSLIRLDSLRINQPSLNIHESALWRAKATVSAGNPSIKSMKAVMSVDLNKEEYLKYHTDF